ncbi:SCO1664 family protein [Aestuariimicrobium sp. Y1814]|uniref:SCO1664 family protein n=1 Tax=Aestuariimicrobium sp. Y1814 TaxID=3418742 RepID=UPI003DA79965
MGSNEPGPPAGELTLVGRLVQASNATFLAEDQDGARFIYKPVAGERPLWDFPDNTLGRREVAAWELSRAAGFDVVPPTWFLEGPYGPGSVQAWIEGSQTDLVDLVARHDIPDDWFGIVVGLDQEEREVVLVHADAAPLRRMAIFDVIANNADRKGAHIIHAQPGADEDEADETEGAEPGVASGLVLGVDHGLTFHIENKLRTVLWGWSGDDLDTDELALVSAAIESVEVLDEWLDPAEVVATRLRAMALLEAGQFPSPGDRWPVIPWPPL